VIDVTKPLEAVEIATGRVVPMEFSMMDLLYDDLFYTEASPCPATSNSAWNLDGTDRCHVKQWLIRNVALAPRQMIREDIYLPEPTEVERLRAQLDEANLLLRQARNVYYLIGRDEPKYQRLLTYLEKYNVG